MDRRYTFLDLPVDVIEIIAAKVPVCSVSALARSCRRMADLLTHDSSWQVRLTAEFPYISKSGLCSWRETYRSITDGRKWMHAASSYIVAFDKQTPTQCRKFDKWVVTGCAGGGIKFWDDSDDHAWTGQDALQRQPAFCLSSEGSTCLGLHLSKSLNRIAAGMSRLCVWDLETRQLLASIAGSRKVKGQFWGLSFDESILLASSSYEMGDAATRCGRLFMYDARTFKRIARIKAPEAFRDVQFQQHWAALCAGAEFWMLDLRKGFSAEYAFTRESKKKAMKCQFPLWSRSVLFTEESVRFDLNRQTFEETYDSYLGGSWTLEYTPANVFVSAAYSHLLILDSKFRRLTQFQFPAAIRDVFAFENELLVACYDKHLYKVTCQQ